MTKVTYVPGETDPAVTIWNEVRFTANVPVDLDPEKHMVVVPMPEVTMVDGQRRTTHYERRVSMIELARNNPSFVVEGESTARRPPGRPRLPKTAEEYRSYARAWFTTADDPNDLTERWNHEADLRERCECGEDDVEYLNGFYSARYLELSKSA